MSDKKFVYEIIDVTDDEIFFQCGLFNSLEDAKAELFSDRYRYQGISLMDVEGREDIEVRKRQVGVMSDDYEVVLLLNRVGVYNDETDEELWEINNEA